MSFAIAPELTTERLILRAHVATDFEPYAALFASDHAHYMGKLNRRTAWYVFCSDVAQWPLFGFGAWALVLRETGALVGQVAIQHPDHFPEIEMGWFLMPDAMGQGLATEAARAARDWAFGPRGLTSLVSYIEPANTASIGVATRIGGVLDPDAPRPQGDEDDLVYRHLPEAAA